MLPPDWLNASNPLPGNASQTVEMELSNAFAATSQAIDFLYPQAYLAQLFKNQTKLAAIPASPQPAPQGVLPLPAPDGTQAGSAQVRR
jgi:hypothetical protein